MTTTAKKVNTTAVRTPTDDPQNHTIVLRQLKETTEVAQRLRGDPLQSFVRLGELVNAGIVRIAGDTVQSPSTNAPPGNAVPSNRNVNTVGSLAGGGPLSSDLTLQLVNDVGTPGNLFYYGTSSGGVKGWFVLPTVSPVVISRGATWTGVPFPTAVSAPAINVPAIVPYACTLKEVIILTQGGPGSCQVDIWKAPIGSYPPTSANSICGGTLPQISTGTVYDNTTLAGWTTAFSLDDVLMFHLVSSSVFTEVAVQLRMG